MQVNIGEKIKELRKHDGRKQEKPVKENTKYGGTVQWVIPTCFVRH